MATNKKATVTKTATTTAPVPSNAGAALPAVITVASARNAGTRNKHNQFAHYLGGKPAVAAGALPPIANANTVYRLGKGGTYKANTVWGTVYKLAQGLAAANPKGHFTGAQLFAAIVAHGAQWANIPRAKYPAGQAAKPGTPQYTAFVHWCVTLCANGNICNANRFGIALPVAA